MAFVDVAVELSLRSVPCGASGTFVWPSVALAMVAATVSVSIEAVHVFQAARLLSLVITLGLADRATCRPSAFDTRFNGSRTLRRPDIH